MSCIVPVNRSARSEHSKLIEFNEEPIIRKDPVKCNSPQGTIPLGTFTNNNLITSTADFRFFAGVTSLNPDALYFCYGLHYVILPENITHFGSGRSLRDCPNVVYIMFLSATVISGISNNGAQRTGSGPIYVPDNLVEAYKTSTAWSQYSARIKALSEYNP